MSSSKDSTFTAYNEATIVNFDFKAQGLARASRHFKTNVTD